MKQSPDAGVTPAPTGVSWDFRTTPLAPSTLRAALRERGSAMSFADVIRQWRTNDAFRSFWTASLRGVPFAAYCFEVPPLTRASLGRPFECVFVDSPALAHTAPDPGPFAEHFRQNPSCDVVVFENLGRDALLVAPCPGGDLGCYTHLAAFVSHAAPAQSNALWQRVAEALQTRTGDAPVWLSTAGLGVFWLHVRLDSRPKYYRHRQYADDRFWGDQ
jgi:hypothetical protein